MPVYQVLRRVDAFVDYRADVEAASPEEAAAMANSSENKFVWSKIEVAEFDARLFVSLDADGNEIAATQTGDF
jgi:hypothetical protein